MRGVRVQLHLCLLLVLSQLIQGGQTEVVVEMQPGPLYRVIGQPVSLSCNVTGFSDMSAEQEFRFSVYKPQMPDTEINIASTHDPDFSFAAYRKRVRSDDITIERLSPTSALLRVRRLLDSDGGVYECHTPNPEAVYRGSYNAKITLNVIEDTLTASSPGPASLTVTEGDALSLQCHASSSTYQHTHLSVTWYLHGDGEAKPRPVISLDHDLSLGPGAGFEARYRAGLIGLEKVGGASYRLRMAQLEVSDAGRIYCQAREWILDPDRRWYPLSQRDAEKTSLEVTAKEPSPEQGAMAVRIQVQRAELREGEELSVRCSVEEEVRGQTEGPAGRFFSLAWVRDGEEVARVGPTGVLVIGAAYGGRESGGEMRAARTGERETLLTLRPVRAQDGGVYLCRAWPGERGEGGGGGAWRNGVAQDSGAQRVNVSATESGLSVAMEPAGARSVNEGDALQLTCRAAGVKGRLSVAWQRRKASMATAAAGPFVDVVALTQEGVTRVGEEFGRRLGVLALRPEAGAFVLELGAVAPDDAGTYRCTVTDGDGSGKSHSQSAECDVAVTPAESLLTVSLINRDTPVTLGGSADLVCRVQGPRLPITVKWVLRRRGAPDAPDAILTVAHNHDITWLGERRNYRLKIATAGERDVRHTLRIVRATAQEEGQYQCVVTPFLEKVHRKQLPSNFLAVAVRMPVSRLSLAVSPSHMETNVNTDITMNCSAITVTTSSSLLAVTWLVDAGGAGNQSILVSDRNGVVTPGTWAGLGTRQRISMRRGEGMSFDLTNRQARIGDSGRYYCVVEEWLQDAHGQWYGLSKESAVIELQVQEPVSDFRMDRINTQLQVREGQEVELKCRLTSGASDPAHLYALTWYHAGPSPSSPWVPLIQLERSGVLRYPQSQEELQTGRRLRFSRPSQGSFLLGLGRAGLEASGGYRCQVEQYQLSPEGAWEPRASDTSGTTNLTVKPIVSRLALAVSPSHMETTVNTDITMKCSAVTVTTSSSLLAVTWLVDAGGAGNQSILVSDRNGVVTPGTWVGLGTGQRISMRRGEGRSFDLTSRQTSFRDSGRYYCVVEEWLQDANDQWYALSKDSTVIELQVQQTVSDFRVDRINAQLQVREGQEVELKCRLTSGASDPAHLYALTWYHAGPSPSSPWVPLVQLERSGVLRFPQSQEELQTGRRLRFSRPSQGSFLLGLGRAGLEASGGYRCQVEQYQLSPEGAWEPRASDTSGTTNLTVKPIESNLRVLKLNQTVTQATFNLSCDITARTSQHSQLQVTWFRRGEDAGVVNGDGDDRPIFVAYRNSTLQDLSNRGDRLRFGRPRPSLYTLAAQEAVAAEDSGVYYCEVEEWLQSPVSLSWRRVGRERSGELSVSVQAASEGGKPVCGTWLGILLGVITLLILLGVIKWAWPKLKKGRGQWRPAGAQRPDGPQGTEMERSGDQRPGDGRLLAVAEGEKGPGQCPGAAQPPEQEPMNPGYGCSSFRA